MDYDLSWLKDLGLNVETGLVYTGKPDKYISALQRFYKNYGKNKANVEELFCTGDYENLMIAVHALKSNAKTIGAMEVSRNFEALEKAAKENDVSYILEHTYPALDAYGELVEKLKPIGEKKECPAANALPEEEARETAKELLEALDDFDDDRSKELMKKLSQYSFEGELKDRVKEASDFIDDFMYENAADIIKGLF